MAHAGATRAEVTLTENEGMVAFRVADDGAGFSTDADHGPGLTTMNDRIDALSGRLDIESVPGGGTTLTGTIPLLVRNEAS